jgi:hypothetical protein
LSRYLRRAGLNRAADLEPVVPDIRYEKARPGELLQPRHQKDRAHWTSGHRVTGSRQVRAHGKIGWEFVFVAIDDCSRMAFAEICSDERQHSVHCWSKSLRHIRLRNVPVVILTSLHLPEDREACRKLALLLSCKSHSHSLRLRRPLPTRFMLDEHKPRQVHSRLNNWDARKNNSNALCCDS